MCSTIDGITNCPEPHTLPGTMSLVSRDQTTNFYRALLLAILWGAYTASDNRLRPALKVPLARPLAMQGELITSSGVYIYSSYIPGTAKIFISASPVPQIRTLYYLWLYRLA